VITKHWGCGRDVNMVREREYREVVVGLVVVAVVVEEWVVVVKGFVFAEV
jgi:hypothetical protein